MPEQLNALILEDTLSNAILPLRELRRGASDVE